MKASEILREAAREVDAHWVRNNFQHAGRVCAVGAMRKVAFGHAGYISWNERRANSEYLQASEALRDYFLEQGMGTNNLWASNAGTSDNLIVYVNDEVAKNRTDISRAMEKVAARLEEQA